jgi:hypothetical protein
MPHFFVNKKPPTLVSFLKGIYASSFGNLLSVKKNIIWVNFYFFCALVYKLQKSYNFNSKNIKFLKNEFKTFRCVRLGRSDIRSWANEYDSYFSNSHESYNFMAIEDQNRFSKPIFTLLSEYSGYIEEVMGCFFQPYWIICQKNSVGVESASENNNGWHIDDNPGSFLKCFIYINDVFENNGAFRAITWQHTKKYLRLGFKSYSPEIRQYNQNIIDDEVAADPNILKVMEGYSGTLLLFSNNLIHKGTLPKVGYRLLIQILLIPSMRKLDFRDVENALNSPRKWDIPPNPSFNDYGGLLI